MPNSTSRRVSGVTQSADPVRAPLTCRTGKRTYPRLPLALLLVASVLFRLPALINARGVHSDAAVVGLQAMRVLQGEWSWFIWGAGYQASFEALLAALFFSVAGPAPLALMLVPLVGHLLLSFFVFDILRRRIDPLLAVMASLVLVFTPDALHRVSLYSPRQWSISLVFCGLWFLDRAGGARRPSLNLAAGMFMAMLALYLDFFALQFMVGFGAFAVACAFEEQGRVVLRPRRIAALAVGVVAGLGLLWLVRHDPVAADTTIRVAWARIAGNFSLFYETCLPWLLSYKVFIPGDNLYPDLWTAPPWFHFVQVLGAILVFASVVLAGALLPMRRIPWEVRRLGGLGFLVSVTTVIGFQLSGKPSDMWAVRYLGPILWILPFSLAPVAYLLGRRWTGVWLAPYLLSAAVGGWLSFGPYVDGLRPVHAPRGVAEEEAQLGEFLRSRDVHHGGAQYWLAYRLTLLFAEDPLLVPLNPIQNRYAPYRVAYEAAPKVALVFHPSEPRARPETHEAELLADGQRYEKHEVADFTVLIWQREPELRPQAQPPR